MSPVRHTLTVLVATLLLLPAVPQAAEQVNIYSARKEALIKPLLERFTEKTGIPVRLVTGKADALLTRLQREGRNSPADLLITTDAGRLWRAQQAGVLQRVQSAVLDAAVPAAYREPGGYWFGLSLRARPILYSTERVDPSQLAHYSDLADPKWRGKVCVRSSDNIYNQSLLAAMVAHQGEAKTQAWAEGLVANLARPPQGGDRDQIKAVAAGQCDLALVNSYYFGMMQVDQDEEQRAAAAKTALFWPDQDGNGVHVNISGAGLTAAAEHKAAAIQLLEFLVSDEAQAWYAEVNHEYPVKPGVEIPAQLAAWGAFKADELGLDQLGTHNPEAVRIADRAGWK